MATVKAHDRILVVDRKLFRDDNTRLFIGVVEDYDGGVAGMGRGVPTSDQNGALRLTRRNGVMTSYVQSGGKWVALASGKVPGQVMLGLQLFATSTDWAHNDVSAAFDNFTLKAQNPSCP